MSIYDFKTRTLDDQEYDMAQLKGKALLIVNVASKCGFTPQYKGLQYLYEKYQTQNLVIIGFPCNQFGNQEPGERPAIQSCQQNYGVTFPIMNKIDVNGLYVDPIYKFLKKEQTGILGTEAIKWNFTKFLVDKEGHVVKRFAPTTKPEEIEEDVVKIL
ncbi:redoxin_domain-containing protein [Hexamita inflata]|uniref:Glutathione peroxidase n=1 Tax=Hexamita inflata TaxID=28002 RepID=A0AA86TP28_9EUKA|nr:redoxin domain-containing protein [Hexamita inflata]